MAYYITCPDCGDNNDPGERCSCDRVHEQNKKKFDSLLVDTGGQYSIGGLSYESSEDKDKEPVWN